MTSEPDITPVTSRSFGLKIDCLQTAVESADELNIRVFCKYLPPVPGTISVVILNVLNQVIREFVVATRAAKGEQGNIAVTLGENVPADRYTVRATVVGTDIYSFDYFYVSSPTVSAAERSLDNALDLRSQASELLSTGNIDGAIGSLRRCAPEFVRGHWYDCAAYTYRDLALLESRGGDLDIAKASAKKALLYMISTNNPTFSEHLLSTSLTRADVALLTALLDRRSDIDNFDEIDLRRNILDLLVDADADETSPLLIEVLGRHAQLPTFALHAIQLLALLDQDKALSQLQHLSRKFAIENNGSDLEISISRILERLGPQRVYTFIDEASAPMTATEEYIVEVARDLYTIAFDESDGGDTCYVGRRDSTDEPEIIPTSRDFVKRSLGPATFEEVMYEAGVLTG